MVDEPGPPPAVSDPKPRDPVTVPVPKVAPKVAPKPATVAPPPGKAIEVVTRDGRKRASVAAGVVLDTKLLSLLADAGGLHEIDVTATEAPLLKVVPVIRRFPQLMVDFRAGSWIPGEVTLNEFATSDDLRAVAERMKAENVDSFRMDGASKFTRGQKLLSEFVGHLEVALAQALADARAARQQEDVRQGGGENG